jgi:hypothetical protein
LLDAEFERKMGKLIRLFCAVMLFGIAQGAARAENGACKFAEWGYSYIRVEQQGETWTYLLAAAGPNWRNAPYGYHAPGHLVCESCSERAWGLYYFSDRADLQPATAAERAERRKESFGYPPTAVGSDHLEHYGSREGLSLGPLTGYAILYRFVAREGRNTIGDLLAARNAELLVIHLSDGCVSFETTILLGSRGGGDPWAPLDLLLREVTIEKSRGARAGPLPPPGTGYSAVVRSKRKGE